MIRVERNFYTLRIFFDDTLHVCVDSRALLGIASYREPVTLAHCIEFVMAGATLTTEYDSMDKWLAVLTELRKVI
jgi:hypothetical protein